MVAHRAPKSKRGDGGVCGPHSARRNLPRSLLLRPSRPARDDEASHRETLSAAPGLAEHIAKIIFALDAAFRASTGLGFKEVDARVKPGHRDFRMKAVR